MNKQTLIILGGGLVAALIVALVMQALIGAPEPAPTVAVQDVPQSEVLVAARDLSMGSRLEPADIRWQDWPTNALFAGAITRDSIDNPNAELPIEGRLRRQISSGEPIFRSAIVGQSEGNYVAATLSDGMRAVAISVNAEKSVGGFVKPGDKVDVILTYSVSFPSDQELAEAARSIVSNRAAQTIIENVKVMAIDQTAVETDDVSVSRTITLEVTPEQSEKIVLAEAMGELSLSLRKIGDETLRLTDRETINTVTDMRISDIIKEVTQSEVGTVVENTIRVYNGTSFQEIPVEQTIGRQE